LLSSILENGAVYYPLIFGVPILAGVITAIVRPDRTGAWIVVAAVVVLILLDFALDEERVSDIAFFVVLGLVLSGLGLLARFITKRLQRRA